MTIPIDQARAFVLPGDAKVVTVGNPTIADVTTSAARDVAIVTGKAFGITNVLILDGSGRELAQATISVNRNAASGLVTVQHGLAQRTTFSCSPTCTPTASLGDTPDTFGAISGQMQQRNALATSQ
ncbi:pilus assembly protein N-terminal domain-containing protein [Xanthobacter sp. DSM 14520]|uniref:pilus assembly protein N-terminal domain-containing protein n=1 Tax=Xanthobacter autotrophicus (strain ATCC BAA-1158 / Py2) TaxID=78245 RepID=UPI00372B24C9